MDPPLGGSAVLNKRAFYSTVIVPTIPNTSRGTQMSVSVEPGSTPTSIPKSSTVNVWNSPSDVSSNVMVSPTLKVRSAGPNRYAPLPPESCRLTF